MRQMMASLSWKCLDRRGHSVDSRESSEDPAAPLARRPRRAPIKNRTTVERKSERELVVTRTFNGPARIVFEAWTKPELLKRWWVPKSFGLTLLSCEAGFRVGACTVSCSATLLPRSPWSSSVGTSK
jgi:hypothetical protein